MANDHNQWHHPIGLTGYGCSLALLLSLGAMAYFFFFSLRQPRPTPAAQARTEANNTMGTLNRGQLAYYLEHDRFSPEIDALDLGIATETTFYRYRVELLGDLAVQNIADPKADSGNDTRYVGWIWLIEAEDGRLGFKSQGCEGTAPLLAAADLLPLSDLPAASTTEIPCPPGYRETWGNLYFLMPE